MKRMLARWAVFIIVIPVAAWALSRAGDRVEASRGQDSRLAKGLHFGSGLLKRT